MQQWRAVQGAAVMILLRLFVFFCSGEPYTAAHARGMFCAAAVQAGAALFLLCFRQYLQIPQLFLVIWRAYAVFQAALLTGFLYGLCCQLDLQQPLAVMGLLIPVLIYTVSLHDRATARTAVLLLCIAGMAFLLLPVSGIGTVQRSLLHMPDSAGAAFLREWFYAGETAMLPLIWQKQTFSAARRSTLAWAGFRCIFLPALVLFGTMQNGRLLHFAGNPFFLLLARTPLSDAVRTDGFWMLLAFGCGLLCLTFYLQTAKPHGQEHPALRVFLCYFAALAVMRLLPDIRYAACIGTLFFGILLPCCLILYRICTRKAGASA